MDKWPKEKGTLINACRDLYSATAKGTATNDGLIKALKDTNKNFREDASGSSHEVMYTILNHFMDELSDVKLKKKFTESFFSEVTRLEKCNRCCSEYKDAQGYRDGYTVKPLDPSQSEKVYDMWVGTYKIESTGLCNNCEEETVRSNKIEAKRYAKYLAINIDKMRKERGQNYTKAKIRHEFTNTMSSSLTLRRKAISR